MCTRCWRWSNAPTYSKAAESIGRNAGTDWMMFGVYIRNNIGIAFQCFAGGLFAGLGSLFFLAFNGAFSGALAGYLLADVAGEGPADRLKHSVRYGAAAASLPGTQAPTPQDLPTGEVPVFRLT